MERVGPLYFADEIVKWNFYGKQFGGFSKAKHKTTIRHRNIPKRTEGRESGGHLYGSVHCSIIQNSQKM